MAEINCRFFSGYKPCPRSHSCDPTCLSRDIAQIRILLIHLGALGAVLRSTALLPAIKRKFPSSHITWVTQAPAQHLLMCHPSIDRVRTLDSSDLLELSALEFDIAFVVDKSLLAAAVLKSTQADFVYGFVLSISTSFCS